MIKGRKIGVKMAVKKNGCWQKHEKMGEPYTCHVCGWESSVKRTKPGQFLCSECLKIWEGGKFYPRPK